MKQLNEKVAIVTGAGQGIGEGIALCLAKRGVKVVCTVIRFFFLSFNSKMARTPVLAIFIQTQYYTLHNTLLIQLSI